MSEKLNVTLTLYDWELEAFNTLCDEQGWPMEIMLEQFVKWCIEDGERAEEWLLGEIGVKLYPILVSNYSDIYVVGEVDDTVLRVLYSSADIIGR